ncbi:MAG: bacterial Ig-like domain-containing protein, partial [Lachnospiraceae bacterium]|nr:bacterial Ig-like domain-containing protein [Lachnospiraceae bacterium]
IRNGVTKVEIISETTNEIVVGTTLKYEDAVARIYRENGTTEDVILSPSNTTGGDTSTAGKKTVTYTYKGASAIFEIYVVDVRAKELEIVSLPHKTVYKEGEEFDPDGLSVNVKYNNGDVLPCSDYELSSVDDSAGEKNVEITYLDISTSFEITYEKKDIETLEIISEPDKTEYIEGEDFNPIGMVVKAVFTDGTSRNITDYTVGEINGTGEVEIIISRDGIETTITVNVRHDLECIDENAATCLEDGNIKYYKCTKCNGFFSDEDADNEIEENSWIIKAIGHKPAQSVKENEVFAGCDKEGSYDEVIYCGECNIEISRKKITVKKLGHSWSEWKETKPATTTSNGEQKRVCVNCNEIETKEILKIDNQSQETPISDKPEPAPTVPEPSSPDAGFVDMYRLYNPNSGEHFYTSNAGERDHLVSAGWSSEGIGWKAPTTSNTPVYRLYNPNAGDHHYTMNKAERDNLISVGWNDEGIGWYSDDEQGVPLYRQYNPNAVTGSHNYTTNKSENDWLISVGWNGEGIGWYGVK